MRSLNIAILLVILSFSANDALACSPAKLAILKQQCQNATTIAAKHLYCERAANPHSIRFEGEKNYNVKQ